MRRGDPIPAVGFPAICKPAAEDASVGVEQRSVVRTMRALAERVSSMHERWDEVIVQRYIDGREVNVGIVGDQVLPVSEIQFDAMPKGMWRIVSYRSKWATGSDEDSGAQPLCPASLLDASSPTSSSASRSQAWRVVGGDGYGRVDFRIDRAGKPWILEVNSNPDLSPDAGLARMARVEGLDYGALVRAICERGLHRERPSTLDQWALAQRLSGVAVAGRERRARALRGRAALSGIAHAGRAARLVGPLAPHHRERLVEILEATGVFAPAEIDVALELFDDGMRSAESYELIGVFDARRRARRATRAGGRRPARDGGYDLYWIAVDPARAGRRLRERADARGGGAAPRQRGARLLVAETSSRDAYAQTRDFYERGGYVERARVRGFYAVDDDRVIFSKLLAVARRRGGTP